MNLLVLVADKKAATCEGTFSVIEPRSHPN